MKQALNMLRRWFPAPLAGNDLGTRGGVRMLELIHHRLVLSVCAMPLIGLPLTLWFNGLGRDPRGMLAWTLLYALAAAALLMHRRGFRRRDAAAPQAAESLWLAHWRPIVRNMSLAHGLGLACLGLIVLLTPGHQAFDFVLLLHISLAAVIVGNAAFDLPAVGIFLRLYAFGWGVATALLALVATYWPALMPGGPADAAAADGPRPWPAIVPLSLLLLVALYRRAVIAHNFFVQQVQLEEHSLSLAQDYQRATERAEQALRAKNQFLSTASHDLRQPAHAMGFLVESIAHRNRDPALGPALEDLRRSVRSLNLMFNALLDLSRIEGEGVDVRRVPVALDGLLHEVATTFGGEARSRGLSLRVRLGDAGATVLADPVLLRQSLVNLTHNALRYTTRGGVLLAARRRGPHWRLEVCDTGMGIAREDIAQVYSPFYRHPSAARIDSAGHGLGLAVVARCADLMGAPYGLQSVEGRGSRFWLLLPATASHEAAALHARAAALGGLSGRCLLVDDDPDVAGAWTSLMQAWGVEVRSAASAAEAEAVLDAGFAPQAILCDQRLRSGESGWAVLKALFLRCPDAAGAMVSGEFASEELQQAERDGYLVLRKPLEVEQLHALLAQWLDAAPTLPQ